MHRQSDLATILIVEDDAVLGHVLQRVLTHKRQTALSLPSTSQALSLVQDRWPRLVLLDTCLRDGSALKLAEAIRAVWDGLPLIFLTAYPLHRSAFPEWADKLVTKSISLPELRRTVDAVLTQRKARLPTAPVNTVYRPISANSQQHARNANR
jgi:two-component system OmpR family response regulator